MNSQSPKKKSSLACQDILYGNFYLSQLGSVKNHISWKFVVFASVLFITGFKKFTIFDYLAYSTSVHAFF